MEFQTLCSWYPKLSSDENVEELADLSSSEMLSRIITERHISPKISWCSKCSVFVVVLANVLHRYGHRSWGHTCPGTVAALLIQSLNMFIFSATSPCHVCLHLSDPTFTGRRRESRRVYNSLQCSNTELSHVVVPRRPETNEGEQIPIKNPSKGCPCLVNPFLIRPADNLKKIGCNVFSMHGQTERSTVCSHKRALPVTSTAWTGPSRRTPSELVTGVGPGHSRRPCLVTQRKMHTVYRKMARHTN